MQKALPCPQCKKADLQIGDCGYSSFNVAWVKCMRCKLIVQADGDSAILVWNRQVKDPQAAAIQYALNTKQPDKYSSHHGYKTIVRLGAEQLERKMAARKKKRR